MTIPFLLLVAVILPLLAYLSKRKLDEGYVFPRLPFYGEALAVQAVMAAISLAVAFRLRIDLPSGARPRDALAVVAVLAAALGAMLATWHASPESVRERLMALVPQTSRERVVWVFVCAGAAFGEEITYRGVLMSILARSLDRWLFAAVLAAFIFGLAHVVQGWRSAAIAAIFGYVFQLVVRLTGSLAPAIGIHFLYDLITGLAISRLARRSHAEVRMDHGSSL